VTTPFLPPFHQVGVLSTTADKDIALDYVHKFVRAEAEAGRTAGGIVFETKMGIVDRGAELEWLSQVRLYLLRCLRDMGGGISGEAGGGWREGIVFKTTMGIVDRGAELEWLSQVLCLLLKLL
jgi:hypothetical protein